MLIGPASTASRSVNRGRRIAVISFADRRTPVSVDSAIAVDRATRAVNQTHKAAATAADQAGQIRVRLSSAKRPPTPATATSK